MAQGIFLGLVFATNYLVVLGAADKCVRAGVTDPSLYHNRHENGYGTQFMLS